MNITILSTIRGKRFNLDAVKEIDSALKISGNTVHSEHIFRNEQQDLSKMSEEANIEFHKQILNKIKKSEIVVAECSYQSLSVGFLLSYAIDLGKIVFILYRKTSAEPNIFLTLRTDDSVHMIPYTNVEEIRELVEGYLRYVEDDKTIRFNLFLSSKINAYLNWISKKYSLSKAAFVRELILQKMSTDIAYRG